MTISSEAQLWQAFDQIERLQQGLRALRADLAGASPANFAMLAEGPMTQVAELQGEIDAFLAGARGEEPLWVRLEGPTLHLGDASSSILTYVLDALRKGVQTVAELKLRGALSARPTAQLNRACDFRIMGFAAGSLRVAVRLPDVTPDQPPLPLEEVGSQVPEALRDYLRVAAWAATDADAAELETTFPDAKLRRAILGAVRRVAPRQRGGLEAVEFSGLVVDAVGAPSVRLERSTRNRIDGAIGRIEEVSAETHRGILREIDLDQLGFILRKPGSPEEVKCSFGEEILEDAKAALDRLIEVTGTRAVREGRNAAAPLLVTSLDVIEEDEPGSTDPTD
jgi:hypothetical protein